MCVCVCVCVCVAFVSDSSNITRTWTTYTDDSPPRTNAPDSIRSSFSSSSYFSFLPLVPRLIFSLQEPIRKRLPEMTLVRDIKMILSRAFKIDPANQVKMVGVLRVVLAVLLGSTSSTNNNIHSHSTAFYVLTSPRPFAPSHTPTTHIHSLVHRLMSTSIVYTK